MSYDPLLWLDYLTEVGDPILRERQNIRVDAAEAVALERHAYALRGLITRRYADLLDRVQRNWAASEIERAQERARTETPGSSDPVLQSALEPLDGSHLALEAIIAFKKGAVVRQQNLLSTATEQERLDTLARLVEWWNVAALPVYDRSVLGSARERVTEGMARALRRA